MAHISGFERDQLLLLPEAVDDYVGSDNPVRFIDAFVDGLDLVEAGFGRVQPKATGRPGYAPGDLLNRTSGTIERNSLMGLDIEIEFCLRGDLEAEEIEGAGLGGRWPCEDGCGACVAEADAVAREVGEVL